MGSCRTTLLSELVKRGLETCRELLSRALSPVMQENDHWAGVDHVMVDRHDIETVLTQSLQNRSDLILQHGHIAGDGGIQVAPDKGSPGVESHTRVDLGPLLRQLQIVAPDGDLVDWP